MTNKRHIVTTLKYQNRDTPAKSHYESSINVDRQEQFYYTNEHRCVVRSGVTEGEDGEGESKHDA